MKYPAYPKYKPSGVEWLGDMPEHWEVRKLSWLYRYSKGKNAATLTKEHVGQNPGDYPVYSGQTENDGLMGSIDYYEFDFVQPVILVSTVGAKAMTTRLVRGKLNLSQNCALIIPRSFNLDARYYEGVLKALFDYERRSISLIMQPSLRFEDLDKFRVPVLPLNEQRAIADFLDVQTVKLDALIAKKRALIETLREKRTALISHTVTRGLPPEAARAAGLNPHPKLKPSGIEWLGDVPEHWAIMKFGRSAFFQEGPGLRNWQFTNQGVRVICVTNITNSGIDFSNYEKFISEEEYLRSYQHFTVSRGDLLLSSSGNSWGKVAEFKVEEVSILNTSTIRINSNNSSTLVRPFLRWLLQTYYLQQQLEVFMTGACQPNFGPSHLARVVVVVPTHGEQLAIANYLDHETARLDRMIEKIEAAIERLQEYRTALITAAVTGKIDVRHAVA